MIYHKNPFRKKVQKNIQECALKSAAHRRLLLEPRRNIWISRIDPRIKAFFDMPHSNLFSAAALSPCIYSQKKVKKGVDNPLTVWYKRYVDSDKDITV